MSYSPLPSKTSTSTLTITDYDAIKGNFEAGAPDVFTAKGDLIAATGADAAARVAITTGPALLVPDTSQSAGLAWRQIQRAVVATAESKSGSTYGDLTTVGPSVTVTVGASGIALVLFSAKVSISGDFAYFGARVDSTDPTDAQAARLLGSATISGFVWLTGLSAASHTLKLVYRTVGGNTGQFSDREIVVIPL